MRITKKVVDAHHPSDKVAYIWDKELSGFGVTVLPSGRKTYLVQYRTSGRVKRTRRVTIGSHGSLSCEQARGHAKKVLGNVALGIDPLEERDLEKKAMTVAEILEFFFVEHVQPKLAIRTQYAYHTIIHKTIPISFRNLPIKDVTRQDVARVHHALGDMPCTANKTLAMLSKFFNWSEKFGYRREHSNPCRHVEKYKENPRQRFLSLS